jgi:hypothetical protein
MQTIAQELTAHEPAIIDPLAKWRNQRMRRCCLHSRSTDLPVRKTAAALIGLCFIASWAATNWAAAEDTELSPDAALAQLKVVPIGSMR